MKKLHCDKCGELVGILVQGTTIKRDTTHLCRDCNGKRKQDKPEFLKSLFGWCK